MNSRPLQFCIACSEVSTKTLPIARLEGVASFRGAFRPTLSARASASHADRVVENPISAHNPELPQLALNPS
jgi:hypothetical protein